MDKDERQRDSVVSIDRDAQINVVLNSADDGDSIELSRVFHNFKLRRRIYAWVVLLCFAAGVCGALVMYQVTKPPLTVSSVVTLNYEIPNPLLDPIKNPDYYSSKINLDEQPLMVPVPDLSAPDGEALDLNQIVSSSVLRAAVSGLELSQPITLANLQDNIKIDKLLTEESLQQQELAASLLEDKNASAISQDITLTYTNRFVVSLTNGFGDETSRVKRYLTDSELRLVLDRILDAYNDYLASVYADGRMPNDEISVIDLSSLEVMESLDLMRAAMTNLYDYCDAKTDAIKAYRSWRTGRTLADLMQSLSLAKELSVDYLYAEVYSKDVVKDRDAMLVSYRYQLRNTQGELDVVNENIANTQLLLDTYKNDEIYVSSQETDAARSTTSTTDYYNGLVTQQAANYVQAAELETTIADLRDKIDNLLSDDGESRAEGVSQELASALAICRASYEQIRQHMEEITDSAFYTTFAEHTVAQGESESFISGSMKKVLIGGGGGIVIALALWFFSALAPEFQLKKEEEAEGKEATGDDR